ncbi:MAG: hypothetical protein M3Z05_21180 [Gemmatimonadota bacterium]|nr:hypothetical protein [Gemmatimonadota bacterium]
MLGRIPAAGGAVDVPGTGRPSAVTGRGGCPGTPASLDGVITGPRGMDGPGEGNDTMGATLSDVGGVSDEGRCANGVGGVPDAARGVPTTVDGRTNGVGMPPGDCVGLAGVAGMLPGSVGRTGDAGREVALRRSSTNGVGAKGSPALASGSMLAGVGDGSAGAGDRSAGLVAAAGSATGSDEVIGGDGTGGVATRS